MLICEYLIHTLLKSVMYTLIIAIYFGLHNFLSTTKKKKNRGTFVIIYIRYTNGVGASKKKNNNKSIRKL